MSHCGTAASASRKLDPEAEAHYNLRLRHPDALEQMARWQRYAAQARAELAHTADVAFGNGPDERIDIFPAAQRGAPAVMFIHGGYWQAGDKADVSFVASELVRAGIALAVNNYSLAPGATLDRTRALVRTQLPVPQSRTAAICVPVPAPGVYALDVRHDVNGNDVTDRGDGGGISGNPRLSIWDVIFRRRPSPKVTQVEIAQGVKQVPIRVQYP